MSPPDVEADVKEPDNRAVCAVDFTREEARFLLAVVRAAWNTPLGSREAAGLLGAIEDKLRSIGQRDDVFGQ